MNAHELARILLAGPDVPVVHHNDDRLLEEVVEVRAFDSLNDRFWYRAGTNLIEWSEEPAVVMT